MAQTAPVAEWTEEAVLGYDVGRWDHAMLKMADFDIQDYERARKSFTSKGAKSRPETVERAKQEFLQAKRTLLVELMELRAATGQAQSRQLRTASAVIQMTSTDADKVVDKMVATMTQAASKMAKLKKEHAKLMVGLSGHCGTSVGPISFPKNVE